MKQTETCISCGAEIPEGRHVCPSCEGPAIKEREYSEARYINYIFRGDVFFADLNPIAGSEIGGVRPVVVLQNDYGNRHSTTIVAAVTSRQKTAPLPTHVKLPEEDGGLIENTTILREQIRTIDKRRLKQYLGHLSDETMKRVNYALARSTGLDAYMTEEGGADRDI